MLVCFVIFSQILFLYMYGHMQYLAKVIVTNIASSILPVVEMGV